MSTTRKAFIVLLMFALTLFSACAGEKGPMISDQEIQELFQSTQ